MKQSHKLLFIILFISLIAGAFFAGKESEKKEVKIAVENDVAFNETTKTPETTRNCRPAVKSSRDNYVIGYGSLMNKDSRMITVPDAKFAAPILVSNFERVWASRGTKSNATYLLAIPNDGYLMNAIYYPSSAEDIQATDLREASYCRVKVPRKDILPLGIKSLPKGDYWMYVKSFSDAEFPTKDFPILQSYADVFLTGCLQTQGEFNLTEFGKLCFTTTYNWDLANWMNDRSHPQYARYSDTTRKYTNQIDGIISRMGINDDQL
ncbi:gamma-glutamylcyclotransferase family protein [Pseudofrancisella aestuarii]|uniref:Gamma-glutamylcyclotransferase family protein n=1 Tax=Pseudofrancisella aestuarii TaxID=2670347 RepID=A0ABV9TAG8_9GAMM|nr:gamma-glutamylcyclotransferase family protein [Pseudofrancisella aestuarii]